jgi:serine/threonine protein kinase
VWWGKSIRGRLGAALQVVCISTNKGHARWTTHALYTMYHETGAYPPARPPTNPPWGTLLPPQGVVHRDIKGANILTTKEGVVKLADFGVAAKLGELEADVASGKESTPVGSPYWMAPEVVEMKSVGAAADIWSVACLAIELLTGSGWVGGWVGDVCVCVCRSLGWGGGRGGTYRTCMHACGPASVVHGVGACLLFRGRPHSCVRGAPTAGNPPYYDMQPMSALYNIVQEKHPPLPQGISSAMLDFLLKCFQKVGCGCARFCVWYACRMQNAGQRK